MKLRLIWNKIKEIKTIDTQSDEELVLPTQMDSVRSIKEIDYNSVRRNKSENPVRSGAFSACKHLHNNI